MKSTKRGVECANDGGKRVPEICFIVDCPSYTGSLNMISPSSCPMPTLEWPFHWRLSRKLSATQLWLDFRHRWVSPLALLLAFVVSRFFLFFSFLFFFACIYCVCSYDQLLHEDNLDISIQKIRSAFIRLLWARWCTYSSAPSEKYLSVPTVFSPWWSILTSARAESPTPSS